MSGRADQLRRIAMVWALRCDPCTDVPAPTGSRLGDVLSVLGLAAAATVRFLGPAMAAGPWPLIAVITGGQLLAPLPDR